MITFFHFFAVFLTPIIFNLGAIIMSCLNLRFRVFDQNKPAITCSRADHVGFQTDSVTSN